MDPGVQIRGGPKSAVTPALRTEVTQRYRLPKTNLKLEISALKRRRGISKKTRNNQGNQVCVWWNSSLRFVEFKFAFGGIKFAFGGIKFAFGGIKFASGEIKFAFGGIKFASSEIKFAFGGIKFAFHGIKFAFCGIKFAFCEFKFLSKESSF
ncbi:hypothetical protein P5673_016378 [Acropora cervicornis]|uniref:Uncharacterized protein n=1 Tax=Acropora cervicornis TaxID=6130 RepID=A0AAD9V463_ACRCE|nr:hypothetical protein P5673_016378 [Acropora cervicornis]